LRPDRLVTASVAVMLLMLVWAAANWTAERGPVVLGWLPTWAAILVAAAAMRRAATSPGLPRAGRRFWHQLVVCCGFVLVATIVQGVEQMRHPELPGTHIPLAALLADGGEAVVMLWALIRLPVGRRTRPEWVRLALDGAAVALSATLFIWYFTAPYLVDGPTAAWAGVTLAAMTLAAVLALAKVVLTGAGPVDSRALRILAGTLLAGGLSAGLAPLLEARPQIGNSQLIVPLCGVFAVLAAERQRRAASAGPLPAHEADGRRYSLLPYAAVAATDALLVGVAAARLDGAAFLVVICAVALTVLVAVRQLAALRENDQLLDEIGRHERRFRSLVQQSADIITVTRLDGSVAYVTPAIRTALGFAPEEFVDRIHALHPEDAPRVGPMLAALRERPGDTIRFETRIQHADGSWRWLDVTSTNLLEDPSVEGLVHNARDITESRGYRESLRHRASHDALTELANRSAFGERLGAALAAREQHLAVLLIDLDDFKIVNDTLGHDVGDGVLVAAAGRLLRCVRPEDTVARLGGDEFAVLLRDVDYAAVQEVAERIGASVAQPIVTHGHTLLVQASIGIAPATPGHQADEILRHADIAMYEAKAGGKARFAEYAPAMGDRIREHAALGAELRQALAAEQLHVVYQPVVELPGGSPVGVEALVRWTHPTRGLISPAEFIPAAERTGLIVPLGMWVLRRALSECGDWMAAHPRARLAVNVAARQLQEPDFAEHVGRALGDAGVAPDRLLLEVTESAVLEGRRALDALEALERLGVWIALDDFGTGQSSLGLLRTCPVNVIKLDKSFVDEVTTSDQRAAVATAVLQMADALGLIAVAEGIETAEQATRLAEIGYRRAQGYHFARPLPAAELPTVGLDARV
jgi:diguanylate cyclase (GGDEF)-like protein/PAS domain S-box-containing protein